MDSEPAYENHPVGRRRSKGWFDEYDVRKACYWALFAGAAGHTYGCHDIWMMWDKGKNKNFADARTGWRDAIKLPGVDAGRHREEVDGVQAVPHAHPRPDADRRRRRGKGGEHVQATRDTDGTYAMVYFPTGKAVTVDLSKLKGKQVEAHWFDPRTGKRRPVEFPLMKNEGSREFKPPSTEKEPDWVLVLDAK